VIDEKRFTKTQGKEVVHNVIMENRKRISISGIEDVESFDEDSIILYTELGTLQIKGEDLHINKLSVESGEVMVEGEIDSLTYSDSDGSKNKGIGFFGKLFK